MPPLMPPSWGVLWADADKAEREELMKRVAEKNAEKFEHGMKLLMDNVSLNTPPPDERAALYLARPPEAWEMLRQLNPKAYAEDKRDFETLIARQEKPAATKRLAAPARRSY